MTYTLNRLREDKSLKIKIGKMMVKEIFIYKN